MMSVKKLGTHLAPLCGAVTAPSPALAGVAGVMANRQVHSAQDKPKSKKQTKASKRVVFISQSTNVFANLAFEGWMYKNWCFDKREVLLLWRNSPAVVIGRHQNPLVEANLPYLASAGVPVARRYSGGGAVYHDEGNLNCTFFTARDGYKRRENLGVICRSLQEDFGIDAVIDPRDNIVIGEEQHKVSGSAAKLGRTTAYHHCSLLVNADKMQLKLSLQGDKSIQSSASASIPSPVKNLRDLKEDITVDQLLTSIGRTYLQSSTSETQTSLQAYQKSNGYTLINPTDDWFPGLGAIQEELASQSWLHNKTPRFVITRPVTLPECVAHDTTVNVAVQAYHGHIEQIKVVGQDDVCPDVADLVHEIGRGFKGVPFSMDVFPDMANRMRLPQPLQTQRFVA